MSTTDGAVFLFFQVLFFFAEFLGFETNVISTHQGVTFHAPVVSSRGHNIELNFNLAHCGPTLIPNIRVYTLKFKTFFHSPTYMLINFCLPTFQRERGVHNH